MTKKTIKQHIQKKVNEFFLQLDEGTIDPDSVFIQTRTHKRETLLTRLCSRAVNLERTIFKIQKDE